MATKFKDIQDILDAAVNNEPIGGPHGSFWQNVTRDQFVILKVLDCPIIQKEGGKFVGASSLLVKILKASTKDCKGTPRPQMPYGFDPVPPDKIKVIEDWIDAQCSP
jgi:hypothetical protein